MWSSCYHLELMLSSGANVIIWNKMLSSGMKCHHLELMLSSGTKCYQLELLLSSGMKCHHLELMLSSGTKCYPLELLLSSGMKCYHLKLMLSSEANVINWCYHLMLSSGIFFLKTSLTRFRFTYFMLNKNVCEYGS
jgi:hypothetical protein